MSFEIEIALREALFTSNDFVEVSCYLEQKLSDSRILIPMDLIRKIISNPINQNTIPVIADNEIINGLQMFNWSSYGSKIPLSFKSYNKPWPFKRLPIVIVMIENDMDLSGVINEMNNDVTSRFIGLINENYKLPSKLAVCYPHGFKLIRWPLNLNSLPELQEMASWLHDKYTLDF